MGLCENYPSVASAAVLRTNCEVLPLIFVVRCRYRQEEAERLADEVKVLQEENAKLRNAQSFLQSNKLLVTGLENENKVNPDTVSIRTMLAHFRHKINGFNWRAAPACEHCSNCT